MPEPRWGTVFFDLDGTLADTIPLIVASYQHAFRAVLGEEVDEVRARAWIGRPLLPALLEESPEHGHALDVAYREWNLAHTSRLIRRYAGVPEMLTALAESGLGFADFDTVFLTHAHPDHVGWTVDESTGRPRFANARYLVHERDWRHFGGRETVPPYFKRFVQPLHDAGVLELLQSETEISPGVTALETPGHTPGHMSLLVQSRGEGFVIAGDVLNSPIYLTEPERPFGSDADIPLGIRTRVELVERIETEGWRVAAAHFPQPGWGDVVRIEGRRWFRAL